MLSKIKQNLPAIILFLFFASLYIHTAAPGVYDGDSGEIAAAVNTLGLAHPTGFPLYMLTGKLFTLLIPIGDIAYRLNVFSAILTASALVFVYYILINLGNSPFASLTASFILGLGRNTIWRNATFTNVYALSLLLATILLFIFSKWKKDPQIKYLYFYGLVWGLSLGTHTAMLIMVIPFLFMLWQTRAILKKGISPITKIGLITIIPLFQYLYLFFAYGRNSIVTWGSMASWGDFIYYITQRQYEYKMWSRDFAAAISFFKNIGSLLVSEFTVVFFCVAIIGSLYLLKKDRNIFVVIFLIASANTIMLLGYGGSGAELFILFRYIFITDLALAIFIAFGLDKLADHFEVLKSKKSLIFFMSIIVLIISFQFKYAIAGNNRRNNYLIEDTARNIFNTVETNAIILAFGDPIIGPLWYYQSIGERKDVVIVSSSLMPFKWYTEHLIKKYSDVADGSLFNGNQSSRIGSLIKNNISKRPIYAVFNSSSDGKLEQEYDFIPYGILNKLVIKKTIDLKEIARVNKNIWSQYVLRNVHPDMYNDNDLKVMAQTYALSLYSAGLAYYYSGMTTESIDALQKSFDIFPHSETKKNLDYIRNKKSN